MTLSINTAHTAAFDYESHLSEWGGKGSRGNGLPSYSQNSDFLLSQSDLFLKHYHFQSPADLKGKVFGNIWQTGSYSIHSMLFSSHRPDAKRCLLIHGYFDNAGYFKHLIDYLGDRCHVLTIDLPGHGLSSGPRAEINDISEYMEVIEKLMAVLGEKKQLPDYFIGHSAGGAILLEAGRRHLIPEASQTVLLAPLIYWHQSFLTSTLIGFFSSLTSVPRFFRSRTHDSDFNRFQREEPFQHKTVPLNWARALIRWQKSFVQQDNLGLNVTVIQGTADKVVDWPQNLAEISRLIPKSRIYLVEGAMHQLINEPMRYRKEVFSKIDAIIR